MPEVIKTLASSMLWRMAPTNILPELNSISTRQSQSVPESKELIMVSAITTKATPVFPAILTLSDSAEPSNFYPNSPWTLPISGPTTAITQKPSKLLQQAVTTVLHWQEPTCIPERTKSLVLDLTTSFSTLNRKRHHYIHWKRSKLISRQRYCSFLKSEKRYL